MDKFMYYIPYWFRGAKRRYFSWFYEFLLASLAKCSVLHSSFILRDVCVLPRTVNKSITIFIKYGVRLY